jgi:hypothetical protein
MPNPKDHQRRVNSYLDDERAKAIREDEALLAAKAKRVKEILSTLQTEDFYQWYRGEFEAFVGNDEPPTLEQIHKDIEQMFRGAVQE